MTATARGTGTRGGGGGGAGRRRGPLPGFGLTLGITLGWLGLIVLLPLSALVLRAGSLGWSGFWETVATERSLAAFRLSLTASLAAAAIDLVLGVPTAWVLVRHPFPGRRVLDALVDLPFALPTAVAGLTLTSLYSQNGLMGRLLEPLGLKVAFTPVGVALALAFVSFPFVVRTVQPVLEDLDPSVEEAAAVLGASRVQVLARVVLPVLAPAVLTGFTLAFARALGEYGSIVFISGNMPMKTEIVPLLIVTKLEQFDYGGATALAVLMLGTSLLALAAANGLHRVLRRRGGA